MSWKNDLNGYIVAVERILVERRKLFRKHLPHWKRPMFQELLVQDRKLICERFVPVIEYTNMDYDRSHMVKTKRHFRSAYLLEKIAEIQFMSLWQETTSLLFIPLI